MADITLLYGAKDAIRAGNLTDALAHIDAYLAQLRGEKV